MKEYSLKLIKKSFIKAQVLVNLVLVWSGTCFCNIGYEGIDCFECQITHYRVGNLCYPKKLCPNNCNGAACAGGYYLTGYLTSSNGTKVCSTCYDFDPRCAGCTKDQGCTVCADSLLTSVRRSGYRSVDPLLPIEENTRELSITLPFGTKSPESFAEAEDYFVVTKSNTNYLKDSTTRCDQGLNNTAAWVCSPYPSSYKVCGHYGVFSFEYPNYQVSENYGYLRLSVKRSGGGYGEVSVYYNIKHITTNDSDVTATAPYTTLQKLVFESGVVEKTFIINILQDTIVEENEVFQVFLETPEGGGSLSPQFRANYLPDYLTVFDSVYLSNDNYSINDIFHVAGSPFYVTINPSTTFAPYSTIYGLPRPLQLTAGECFNFTIQARDKTRNFRYIGGDNFQVFTLQLEGYTGTPGQQLPEDFFKSSNHPTTSPTITSISNRKRDFQNLTSSANYPIISYGNVVDLYTAKHIALSNHRTALAQNIVSPEIRSEPFLTF
eukprot:gene17018-22524_t